MTDSPLGKQCPGSTKGDPTRSKNSEVTGAPAFRLSSFLLAPHRRNYALRVEKKSFCGLLLQRESSCPVSEATHESRGLWLGTAHRSNDKGGRGAEESAGRLYKHRHSISARVRAENDVTLTCCFADSLE